MWPAMVVTLLAENTSWTRRRSVILVPRSFPLCGNREGDISNFNRATVVAGPSVCIKNGYKYVPIEEPLNIMNSNWLQKYSCTYSGPLLIVNCASPKMYAYTFHFI
jgi:hypothetical protein